MSQSPNTPIYKGRIEYNPSASPASSSSWREGGAVLSAAGAIGLRLLDAALSLHSNTVDEYHERTKEAVRNKMYERYQAKAEREAAETQANIEPLELPQHAAGKAKRTTQGIPLVIEPTTHEWSPSQKRVLSALALNENIVPENEAARWQQAQTVIHQPHWFKDNEHAVKVALGLDHLIKLNQAWQDDAKTTAAGIQFVANENTHPETGALDINGFTNDLGKYFVSHNERLLGLKQLLDGVGKVKPSPVAKKLFGHKDQLGSNTYHPTLFDSKVKDKTNENQAHHLATMLNLRLNGVIEGVTFLPDVLADLNDGPLEHNERNLWGIIPTRDHNVGDRQLSELAFNVADAIREGQLPVEHIGKAIYNILTTGSAEGLDQFFVNPNSPE
jgi:hypothetical protein